MELGLLLMLALHPDLDRQLQELLLLASLVILEVSVVLQGVLVHGLGMASLLAVALAPDLTTQLAIELTIQSGLLHISHTLLAAPLHRILLVGEGHSLRVLTAPRLEGGGLL